MNNFIQLVSLENIKNPLFLEDIFVNGGDLEIRTLARPWASYRFSRPTPSTTWVNLRILVDPADPDTATNRL